MVIHSSHPGSQPLADLMLLESGDSASADLSVRLSRSEFERRYAAMPQIKKAELIEGVVYVASPVRSRSHGHMQLSWHG